MMVAVGLLACGIVVASSSYCKRRAVCSFVMFTSCDESQIRMVFGGRQTDVAT
jgi:hypothetical protein